MKRKAFNQYLFTVPSAPPTLITVQNITSFNINLFWDPLNCTEQNGDITGYSVRYGVEESGSIKNMYVSGGATTEATISGLNPSTNYFTEVAAVNSAGSGVYSTAIFTLTKGIIFTYI